MSQQVVSVLGEGNQSKGKVRVVWVERKVDGLPPGAGGLLGAVGLTRVPLLGEDSSNSPIPSSSWASAQVSVCLPQHATDSSSQLHSCPLQGEMLCDSGPGFLICAEDFADLRGPQMSEHALSSAKEPTRGKKGAGMVSVLALGWQLFQTTDYFGHVEISYLQGMKATHRVFCTYLWSLTVHQHEISYLNLRNHQSSWR